MPVGELLRSDNEALSRFQRDRRRLLGFMASTAGLMSGACSGPPERQIVPYAAAPEGMVPGVPAFYATALSERGYAIGALVETNGGRPTKIEGNPRHPASLGGTTPQMQAEVLQLWDPARSSVVLGRGQVQTWIALQSLLEEQRVLLERQAGAGLHVLMRPSSSPTLAAQLDGLRQHYPQMRLHLYDPIGRELRRRGAELAFGRSLEPVYHLDRARIIVNLDADFLQGWPESVRYARDLIATRDPQADFMSRIYAVESTPGLIGALADHRLALAPASIELLSYRLAAAFALAPEPAAASPASRWESSLIGDLRAHLGACLFIAGDGMSASVHALSHALNERLGAQGVTHDYIEPQPYMVSERDSSLEALVAAAHAGAVRLLLILDGNPAYDAPVDLDFAAALAQVPQSLHWSRYVDETSRLCTWHVPATHALEHWSDLRAFDGTASIVQPVIAPLYGGRSPHELLDLLTPTSASADGVAAGRSGSGTTAADRGYQLLRAYWRDRLGRDYSGDSDDDESRWRELLRSGVVANTAAPPVRAVLRLSTLPPPSLSSQAAPSTSAYVDSNSAPEVQLLFVPDQSVRDGQWANNAWLQELPRSMSKLTWGNAAYLSPRTAAELGVTTDDELLLEQPTETRAPMRRLRVGVWVLPDQPDGCITLPLGYGRTHAGPVGDGIGFDAYRLRTSEAPWHARARAYRVGTRWAPALTQREGEFNGRDDIVRLTTLDRFRLQPDFATASVDERVSQRSLYPPSASSARDNYRWGMTIDLNACIGCNACTIACQAENNIPIVGPDEVRRGRVMHWIRVDRYYDRRAEALDARAPDAASPRTAFQPVPCMQCEHAPCEEVCPVGATVHDEQGLNLQVYNRCVGTRFCSNNCPYKVRRFNFLGYSDQSTEALKALRNPDVTVRMRGVMEKCTYCLQRIERARIGAELEQRRVRDGEVLTACQAACPTVAIRFGDLSDPQAQIQRFKRSPRNYALLAELNTRPRTTYLAKIRNSGAG